MGRGYYKRALVATRASGRVRNLDLALEGADRGLDRVRFEGAPHRVEGLQALSGDHEHDPLVAFDVAPLGQLRERRRGHTAGGLREDAGGLGQQADALADL